MWRDGEVGYCKCLESQQIRSYSTELSGIIPHRLKHGRDIPMKSTWPSRIAIERVVQLLTKPTYASQDVATEENVDTHDSDDTTSKKDNENKASQGSAAAGDVESVDEASNKASEGATSSHDLVPDEEAESRHRTKDATHNVIKVSKDIAIGAKDSSITKNATAVDSSKDNDTQMNTNMTAAHTTHDEDGTWWTLLYPERTSW